MSERKYTDYFKPLIEVLRELGGSGRAREVTDQVADKIRLTDSERLEINESGQHKYYNQIAWARFYLAKAGLLDSSKRGVWALTEKGLETSLDKEQFGAICRAVQRSETAEENKPAAEPLADLLDPESECTEPEEGHRGVLAQKLLSLPPAGFERLCQRLLRESGFARVTVTGRSGDEGIDGHGVLQISPFVSLKVLFQCKRYAKSVSVATVRDFRGAMIGRAEKGIILTTGSFTSGAAKEAVRDGAAPIELVDLERLMELFETLELGLKPRRAFDIDHDFFSEFEK